MSQRKYTSKAQSKDETTWFNGVTWVDVCTEAGNSTNKISYTADVYSNKTEKNVNVVGGYELKLGLLLLFPTDIILDILSRLPVEDLIRGRIICKSWYKLTKDPQFIHLQVSKATRGPHSFLLDETNVDRGKTLILVDMENDKWRSTEIMFKTIYKTTMNLSNSCNGLVCISANFTGYDPVIHNLLTKDCLILPNSDYKPHQSFSFRMTGFGIGFDSMNKKYKVVRVIYEDIQAKKFHTKAEIITLGESSWRILNFPHTVTTHSIKKPVFLYGALHWLIRREKDCSHSDHVLVLDCINETFETINFPPVELPEDLALINLGETLALSELSERGLFNSDVHRIWQIVGNRRDGGRLRQYTFDISLIHGQFNQEIQLLGMLRNGDFIYKALETGIIGGSVAPFQYHLICYSPQMKTGFSVELPDIPISFNSTLYRPSLVSPSIF